MVLITSGRNWKFGGLIEAELRMLCMELNITYGGFIKQEVEAVGLDLQA